MVARAPDEVRISSSIITISSSNPMSDHLLESSHRDDSNKWSNKGLNKVSTQKESDEINLICII